MKYKVEIKEKYSELLENEDGQTLKDIFKELASQSVFEIIIEKKEFFTQKELQTIMVFVKNLEDNYGILIVTGSEKFRSTLEGINSESVIWLPTKEEAVEAVYMNELESQFKRELDKE